MKKTSQKEEAEPDAETNAENKEYGFPLFYVYLKSLHHPDHHQHHDRIRPPDSNPTTTTTCKPNGSCETSKASSYFPDDPYTLALHSISTPTPCHSSPRAMSVRGVVPNGAVPHHAAPDTVTDTLTTAHATETAPPLTIRAVLVPIHLKCALNRRSSILAA